MAKAVKKTPVKKVVKKAPAKTEITGKSVGRNVIVIIDGEKYSKSFSKKEDRVYVLGLVEAYNKRNSKARLNEIIEILSKSKATSTERKEEAKKKAKPVKKATKPKVVKAPTKAELEAAAKLLKDNNYGKYAKSEESVAKPRKRSGREY